MTFVHIHPLSPLINHIRGIVAILGIRIRTDGVSFHF